MAAAEEEAEAVLVDQGAGAEVAACGLLGEAAAAAKADSGAVTAAAKVAVDLGAAAAATAEEPEAAWGTAGAMELLPAVPEEEQIRGAVEAAEAPLGKIKAILGEAVQPLLAAMHGEEALGVQLQPVAEPEEAMAPELAAAPVAEWEDR